MKFSRGSISMNDHPEDSTGKSSFLRPAIALALSFLWLLAYQGAWAQAQRHVSREHRFQVVTVASGLEHPWAVAFLPGGDMLVTERPGRLLAWGRTAAPAPSADCIPSPR